MASAGVAAGVAAAEVRRANHLIYDQIAALKTSLPYSVADCCEAWVRWSTRELDNDLMYRGFHLGLPER
jgi:hypothetical protein